jgi:hypothetical protein
MLRLERSVLVITLPSVYAGGPVTVQPSELVWVPKPNPAWTELFSAGANVASTPNPVVGVSRRASQACLDNC